MNNKLNRKSLSMYLRYNPDGSGRDSYINANSGGFSKIIPQQVVGPYYEVIKPNKEVKQFRDLSKTSWSFKYKSDGSGRDSYILSGSGGLQNDWRPNPSFGSILRAGFASNHYRPKSTTFKIINPFIDEENKDHKTTQNLDLVLKNKSKGNIRLAASSMNKRASNPSLLTVKFIGRDEYNLSSKLRKVQNSVTKRLATGYYNDCKEAKKLNPEIFKDVGIYDDKAFTRQKNIPTNFNELKFCSTIPLNKPDFKRDNEKINDKILNRNIHSINDFYKFHFPSKAMQFLILVMI